MAGVHTSVASFPYLTACTWYLFKRNEIKNAELKNHAWRFHVAESSVFNAVLIIKIMFARHPFCSTHLGNNNE